MSRRPVGQGGRGWRGRVRSVEPFAPAMPIERRSASLRSIIDRLGLQSGLTLCLDAGDANSYVSGQTWLDTSAAGGTGFFLGVDGAADATDPTFAGTPGGLSSAERFSCDGGDSFRATSQTAFLNSFHQSGAAGTLLVWIFPTNAGQFSVFGSSQNNNANIGVFFTANTTSGAMAAIVHNGSGSPAYNQTSSSRGVVASQWQMLTYIVNQPASAGYVICDNRVSAVAAAAYTTPSAAAATYAMEIGASGNGGSRVANGTLFGMVAGWSRAVNTADIQALHEATRWRWGV